LFDYADGVGAEFVATGHHARITRDEGSGRPALCCGVDPRKDQSYVLFGVDRSRLPRMILPVGEHRKAEIRSVAQGLGLRVAGKRESQEICFVEPGSHARFVRDRRGDAGATGEIVTTDGRVVGRHDGIERFTIGQRKGLGVALGEPQFVVRIEADTHRVVIGGRGELARRELTAGGVNWLVDAPRDAFRCRAKIRYNSPSAEALAEPLAGDRLRVQFDQPCYGVAPGQAVVCYCADRVLGGGWIE
jgi:tRNA-specific 2-thiouridylase